MTYEKTNFGRQQNNFQNFVRSNNNKSFNYCDRGIKINPKRLLWDNRKS